MGSYFEFEFNSFEDSKEIPLFDKKEYISDVLFKSDFSRIVKILTETVENKILVNSSVCSVKKEAGFYSVKTESGQMYKTRKIVFGTGRSSYSSLTHILDSLNAKYEQQPQDRKNFALVIDLQWVKPQLTQNFSLQNDDNIYVLGDAIGKSRGFVQALFSGVMWANLFCKNVSEIKNKEKWLNLA
ncbi:hypothetical protein Barb6XT_03079 [Bacteroidales bacterium Barb6XT]|nr:hypothetical protein Barb6XT_03079 [Bacteroidales bacterium Barb6XT]